MPRDLVELLHPGMDVVPHTHRLRVRMERGRAILLGDSGSAVMLRYQTVCQLPNGPTSESAYLPQLEVSGPLGHCITGLAPLSLLAWCGVRMIPRAVCWRGPVPEWVIVELQRLNDLWEVQPWAA